MDLKQNRKESVKLLERKSVKKNGVIALMRNKWRKEMPGEMLIIMGFIIDENYTHTLGWKKLKASLGLREHLPDTSPYLNSYIFSKISKITYCS